MGIIRSFCTVIAMAFLLVVGSASAATITYTLFIDEDGPGTFNLYADTGLDNGGISGYGVDLSGGVTSLDHKSPVGAFSGTSGGPVGFSLGRSLDDNPWVLGSQDIAGVTWPAGAIYGMGQEASSFADNNLEPIFGDSEGSPWGAPRDDLDPSDPSPTVKFPILLASGTYEGAVGLEQGPNLGANVFPQVGADIVIGADTAFVIIPEPGTFILATCCLLGIVAGRRRGL